MSERYARLTLIAQRGRSELVVTLRRRGSRQTILFDGQLVCSRVGKQGELSLGPAADAFDTSWLGDAIKELADSVGHPSAVPRVSRPASGAGRKIQAKLPS